MKLKKIASLMLAGVMAISMLTACGDKGNSNNGNNGDTDISTPTSTASTTLYNAMSKEARNISSAASNSELDKALADAVDNWVSDSEIKELALKTGYVVVGEAATTGANNAVAAQVAKDMDASLGVLGTLNKDDNKNDKDMTAINVYRSYFGVSDQQVLENAADQMDAVIKVLPTESKDGKYEYDYTVSASVASKTYTVLGSSVTVKYVAVAVAREATKI